MQFIPLDACARFALKTLAFPALVWYSNSAFAMQTGGNGMTDIRRKSVAALCLALGLFILAGVFRQMDRAAAPLPSAACFMLTNLIYIGLAMA